MNRMERCSAVVPGALWEQLEGEFGDVWADDATRPYRSYGSIARWLRANYRPVAPEAP